MRSVSRACYAAAVVVILAPISMADDPPKVATKSELASNHSALCCSSGTGAPGLKMRQQYEPGKIPVVLVHGLWGFPHQWDRMLEYLEAEPELRERFQFWLFGYQSGDSIPFSAHELRPVPAAGPVAVRSERDRRSLRQDGRRRSQPGRHSGENDGPS